MFSNQTKLANLPNLGSTNITGLKYLSNNSGSQQTPAAVVFERGTFDNTAFSKISIAQATSATRGMTKAAAGEIVLPNIASMSLDFRANGETGVFTGMPSLETIDLSNLKSDSADVITANITGLNGLIFNNSPKLANITIAGPIPTIPNYAFKGCTGLQNVDFTQLTEITSIGTGAFQNTTVETVDLSACKKLTTINQDAFRGANIKSLDLSQCDALTTIQNNAFTEVARSAEAPLVLTFPASLTTINNNAF